MILTTLIFLIVIILLLSVIYIYTLIKQAKDSEWVWFVFTIIFSIILIPYWIVKALSK